jgi:DNA-binding GntR family transcriptional regulator
MFVADLRPEDALELYSIRDSLEALAAEEAAKKATEQEKAELSNILKKMNAAAKARDRKRCLDLDLAFHKHIVAMSKHSRVQQMYSLLESQIRLFIALTEPMHKDLFADIVQIHEPIASAILVGNWKTAQALSAHHNRADGEALARSIELALFQEKA